jgi:hypothetical protein
MNLFDAPAWAEALLGNKVKFPSFGTAQQHVGEQPMQAPSFPHEFTSIKNEGAAPLSINGVELLPGEEVKFRKKPGPKPGSKRKVK